MNESKLNMSQLAAQSGNSTVRSTSAQKDSDSESLRLSRLEGATGVARGTVSKSRTESLLYPEALKCLAGVYDAVRRNRATRPGPAL